MAPKRCCVPSCTVTQADGIPMHSFPHPNNLSKPEELERFRTWVMRIGGYIVGEDDFSIHQNRKVCHRHFEKRYHGTKKLTRTAIPSLHIPGKTLYHLICVGISQSASTAVTLVLVLLTISLDFCGPFKKK